MCTRGRYGGAVCARAVHYFNFNFTLSTVLKPPAHTLPHTVPQPFHSPACEHLDGFPFWYIHVCVCWCCELIGPTINAVWPSARCSSAGWVAPQPKRGLLRRSIRSPSTREWLPSWIHATLVSTIVQPYTLHMLSAKERKKGPRQSRSAHRMC